MTPSLDVRIASMIRSMTEVIGPAIDSDNSLAREQASLMVGHLKMLALHWKYVAPFAQACLSDLAATIGPLKAQGGADTMTAAEDLFSRLTGKAFENPLSQYYSAARALEQLVRSTDKDGAQQFRAELQAAVLAFSLRQSERDRAWFAISGFDIDADNLPTIEQIIDGTAKYSELGDLTC